MSNHQYRGRRPVAMATTFALGAVVFAGTPAAAWASDGESQDASVSTIQQSLRNVERTDASLILDATARSTIGTTPLGAGEVYVPLDLSDGVALTNGHGDSFVIALPGAGSADDATLLDSGAITYPGKDSANTVVVAEGSVQLLTTVANSAASTEYAYDIELETDQYLTLTESGAEVLNVDGSTAFAVATPWAIDANGREIPTRYEVDGDTLIQVIDHSSVAGVAYPVVADPIVIAPWVFKCLLGLGLSGPQITAAFASGTIWGGLGRAALACVTGK